MKLIHQLDARGLPPADLKFRLATHFLAQGNPVVRRVLERLVTRPKSGDELASGSRSNSVEKQLGAALRRLRAEGLIDQRIDSRVSPDGAVYELTPLGVSVLFTMRHLEFAYAARAAMK